MNTIKQVGLTTLMSIVVLMAAGFGLKSVAHSSTIDRAGDVPTITVTAVRMTDAQKFTFDHAQQVQAPIQTITVVGHAMTAAQKAAFDHSNKA